MSIAEASEELRVVERGLRLTFGVITVIALMVAGPVFGWSSTSEFPDRLYPEQYQAIMFLETLLRGEIPDGFVLTISDWCRIIDLLGTYALQLRPEDDTLIRGAFDRWIYPALVSGETRVRYHAARMLALFSVTSDQAAVDERLLDLLTDSFGTDVRVQGELFAILALKYSDEVWFQQLYQRFVERNAPGGRTPAALFQLFGVAEPYFVMQYLLTPEGYFAAALPDVQWPTDIANMPRSAQEVVIAIGIARAAVNGFRISPSGLVELPYEERLNEIFSAFDRVRPLLPGYESLVCY